MPTHFTRQELYDLVWSEPTRKLAVRFGISDVALAKTCRRILTPLPHRGYWVKLRAGKAVTKVELPPRPPGIPDDVTVGKRGTYSMRWIPNVAPFGPPPLPPSFPESVEAVRERVRKSVGKVRVPKGLSEPHSMIAQCLAEDERRRERRRTETYGFSSDGPKFDSPVERRRLRILSALFFAVNRLGCRPSIGDVAARQINVHVGDYYVPLVLDRLKETRRSKPDGPGRKREKLQFAIKVAGSRDTVRQEWREHDDLPLERQLEEIATEVIVAGELEYRDWLQKVYRWRLERKAEFEEQIRRDAEEKRRIERERQEKLERARVERLLGQVTALRQANEIRAYVSAVRLATSEGAEPMSDSDFHAWAEWALGQADRIDPVKNGEFRDVARDGQES